MKTQTAAPAATAGENINTRLRLRDAALQDEGACALACLCQPLVLAAGIALAAAFSAIAFARFGSTPRFWSIVPLLAACAVVIVADLRTKTIPDFLTLPGIGYALLIAAFFERPDFSQALLGMAVAGGTVFVAAVISRGAIGGGDIKLMAMLGAALGWKQALGVLAFSQMAAAMIALPLLILRRATRRAPLPIGAIISLLGAAMLLGGP